MANPTITKVGLDPKKPVQYRHSLDPKTKLQSISIIEYWRVVWSAAQDDPSANDGAKFGSISVPTVGTDWRDKGIAQCVDVLPQLDPQSAGKQYLVTVTFNDNVPINANSSNYNTTISFRGERVEETVWFDITNKAIVNSAGQPFSQQPSQTYYQTTIPLKFDSTEFDEQDCESLRGCINQSAVTVKINSLNYARTFPAGTLLLDTFDAAPIVQAGKLSHWEVTESFKYRPLIKSPIDGSMVSPWNLFILDQGYGKLSAGALATIIDTSTNAPFNSPQYLDGSGNPSTTAHYLAFTLKASADFSPLFAGIG